MNFPGWWSTYPSEKYEKVSWDDDIPTWKIKFMIQTTNQIMLYTVSIEFCFFFPATWVTWSLSPCWTPLETKASHEIKNPPAMIKIMFPSWLVIQYFNHWFPQAFNDDDDDGDDDDDDDDDADDMLAGGKYVPKS